MVVEHDDGRAPSHDEESAGSHDHQLQGSEDTDAEAGSHVSQAEAEPQSQAAPVSSQVLGADPEEEEVGLELTLGFEPAAARQAKARSARFDLSAASSLIGLRLEQPA
uniref:Uncharacterized protein n=2 Tax=Setaria TaxID=4554 RepID=K3XTT4_SETIT